MADRVATLEQTLGRLGVSVAARQTAARNLAEEAIESKDERTLQEQEQQAVAEAEARERELDLSSR